MCLFFAFSFYRFRWCNVSFCLVIIEDERLVFFYIWYLTLNIGGKLILKFHSSSPASNMEYALMVKLSLQTKLALHRGDALIPLKHLRVKDLYSNISIKLENP